MAKQQKPLPPRVDSEFNIEGWAMSEEVRSSCETCRLDLPEVHKAIKEYVKLKKTGNYPHVHLTAFHEQLVKHFGYPYLSRTLARHIKHVKI